MLGVVVALSWDQLQQPNINSIPQRLQTTQPKKQEWIYGAVNRVFRLYELDKRHASITNIITISSLTYPGAVQSNGKWSCIKILLYLKSTWIRIWSQVCNSLYKEIEPLLQNFH